ncbi:MULTISPECIES: DUF4123 domain-containing protein [Pseudomonas]|uniref:DUF4123 domain-containing protein n=1 Tax=Pseudomonas fluorescens TaxID=294 RepID=A0A5E7H4Q6_PSEFL|nr:MULTISPECIES: DUF4123 domain-containing protein [Pseudomonas]UST87908.1 DUF4123 domain-containing protein [Pseudomonas siliginis]VVO59139.1 hypothetical protein PS847_00698 [Pseudomonas fluorescens]
MHLVLKPSEELAPTDHPRVQSGTTLWLLADRVRSPEILQEIYKQSDIEVSSLLAGSPHGHLGNASPILVKLKEGLLPDNVRLKLQSDRCGILLAADLPIREHLQYLFTKTCRPHGLVYSRYYDPINWSCLHRSLNDTFKSMLYGPIKHVWTLLPSSTTNEFKWGRWDNPKIQASPLVPDSPLDIPDIFFEMSETLHWHYWIYEQAFDQNLDATDQDLSKAIKQLDELVKSGINQGAHLQSLLPQIFNNPEFTLMPEVKEILDRKIKTHEKISLLESLAKG